MNLQLQRTFTHGTKIPSFWNKTHNKLTLAAINEGFLNLYFEWSPTIRTFGFIIFKKSIDLFNIANILLYNDLLKIFNVIKLLILIYKINKKVCY